MPWFVIYEIRPSGAIGEFGGKGISVTADCVDSALAQARDAFASLGLEVRFPLDAYHYEEN